MLLLALSCIVHSLAAQPFNLDENVKPVELNLYPFNPPAQPKAKGRLNVTNVTQVKDTLYFFAKGMDIYSPAYIGITCKDKANPLDIRLCKGNWHQFSREGSTADSGHYQFTFKTEQDFGLMVIAHNKPADYSIVLWSGDEAKFELPTVFSNDKAATAGAGGPGFFKKYGLYFIIGLLVVVIGLLFFKLKNRKQ